MLLEYAEFNKDSSEWQYVSKKIIADKNYKSITFYCLYYNNENTAYFDGLQLYKEEFGQSYTYDKDGNVLSTSDLADQQSQFEYTNNDVTKYTNIKRNSFEYKYDDKHNITKATSAENVVYTFEYNSDGTPKTSRVESANGAKHIDSSIAYTSDGNYTKTLTDSSGNTVNYDYDKTTGNLKSTVDAEGNTIYNVYDSMDRLVKSYTYNMKNNEEELFPLDVNAVGTKGTMPKEDNSTYVKEAGTEDGMLSAYSPLKLNYDLGLKKESGTIGLWFKTATDGVSRFLMDSKGSNNSMLTLVIDSSNKLILGVRDTAGHGSL